MHYMHCATYATCATYTLYATYATCALYALAEDEPVRGAHCVWCTMCAVHNVRGAHPPMLFFLPGRLQP